MDCRAPTGDNQHAGFLTRSYSYRRPFDRRLRGRSDRAGGPALGLQHLPRQRSGGPGQQRGHGRAGPRRRDRLHLRDALSGSPRPARAATRRGCLYCPLRRGRRSGQRHLLVQRADALCRGRRLQRRPGCRGQRLRHWLHPLRGLLHRLWQRSRLSCGLLRRNRRLCAEDPRQRRRPGLLHLPGGR